ncbi:MAG: class I SAM-dependent methyltransferase [Chloroflexota bacterium]|nr:class I SAM-dependent methyltransferase [Chloroflexota bacterium]
MSEEKNLNQPHINLPDYVGRNKALWEATSETYEQRHAQALEGKNALAWGVWRIPEADLNVLGDVAGKDMLEFGCGAARWSIALAGRGARPVGLDISSHQLAHARRLMAEADIDFPLIEASAEAVPLPDASFDIVFCDWGAMTFCDPYHTVPEAARLLRPGGLFAFSDATPIQFICTDVQTERIEHQLVNDYFGLTRLDWPDSTDFQLPYGEWIRLFRRNHLMIEDLIETRPALGIGSTFRSEEENEWARHWPMEHIWKLRKEGV